MLNESIKIDALLPPQMAHRAEEIGTRKAEMAASTMFVLAVLAGAFIALGAIFATIVATGAGDTVPFGITKLLIGLVFCLGLILVVIAGAELFTGNNLIVMAWANGKVTTQQVLRNWGIVYAGNFAGSIATALIMLVSKQYTFGGGAVGETILSIANDKVHLDFMQAVALGMMCNALVCLAVWLTFSARSTMDKIAAIIFPITAFVAAGFEHSVANMYFIPMGLMVKDADAALASTMDLSELTWGNFLLNNLLPVTIGNIIGGAVMVAAVYWFVYLREDRYA
jgi:formate transporter